MNIIDAVFKQFSFAFDSIINAGIFYRSNRISLLQAGIIVLLPQIAAYLIDYNKRFGIDFAVKLDSYPLLLFVLLVCTLYVLIEPHLRTKAADDVFRLTLLSIHIFAFALSMNLVYAGTLQIFGQNQDIIQTWILSVYSRSSAQLTQSIFALIYGIPFVLISLAIITRNSFRRQPRRMRVIVASFFFWRTLVVVTVLALYQYMAFILVGKVGA